MRRTWLRTTVAVVWVALVLVVAPSGPAAADVSVNAGKFSGIVIDGLVGDWAGITGTTLTLVRPLATAERIANGLTLKLAYDDANLYVLAMIQDDFDYNATDHFRSGSVAVLWQIDPAATPDMGGGNGNVDIWHWELDCNAGVLSGYNLNSGNDPACNFDDEWSSSVVNRFDDGQANELYGVWTHTNRSAPGATGTWIFEMRRSLRTMDTLNQDRQFTVGGTFGMAVAYWDPDESGTGWTASGHYATCKDPTTLDFSWIDVTLVPLQVPTGPTGPEGPAGPTGPQGSVGPAGPTDVLVSGSAYAGLGLGVAAMLLSIAALAMARRTRGTERGGAPKP